MSWYNPYSFCDSINYNQPRYNNFSFSTWNMVNANHWDCANLHWNQIQLDNYVYPRLFEFSSYPSSGFQAYDEFSGSNYNYLLDPRYTVFQTDRDEKARGGSGFLDSDGKIKIVINGNPPAYNTSPWYRPSNPSNSSTPQNNGVTVEERAKERKFNRLNSFVDEFVKYFGEDSEVTDSLVSARKKIANGDYKTYDEKYNALLEAIKKVSKDNINDFMLNGSQNLKITDKGNLFLTRLLATGYEMSGTAVDDKITSINNELNSLADNSGSCENLQGICNSDVDILDFISSWNSYYKSDKICAKIAEKINAIDDSEHETKKTAIGNTITPLVNSLINKSKSLLDDLDESSKNVMNEKIETLQKAQKDSVETVDSGLSDAFEELYQYSRKVAMAKLISDVENYYGDIAQYVFDKETFENEFNEDLENEGFDTDSDVGLKNKNRKPSLKPNANEEVKYEDVQDSYTALIGEHEIEITVNGKTEKIKTTVYVENTATGDLNNDGTPDYTRCYYVKDGKLVEITNYKYTSSGLEIIDKNKAAGSKVLTEDVVEEREEAAKKAKYKAKKESVAQEKNAEIRGYGQEVAILANKNFTEDYDYATINEYLNKLNKDNILSFLDGYYIDANEKESIEGIIEKLDDEWDSGAITMANKRKIIDSVLTLSEMYNLKNDPSYKEIKRILKAYKKPEQGTSEKETSEQKTFNHGGWGRLLNGEFLGKNITSGVVAGAGVAGAGVAGAGGVGAVAATTAGTATAATAASGAIAGVSAFAWPIAIAAVVGGVLTACFDKVTDNEVIDNCLKDLYNKIKAQENKELNTTA